MKAKKKIIIIIISVIAFILILSLLIPRIFLSDFLYSDNTHINSDINQEIKELVLNSFKDLFLISDFKNSENLYLETDDSTIIQLDENSDIVKSTFFVIERDFMNNLSVNENGEYYLIVKTYFPKSYFCHITISETENGYKIKSFGLDT